MEGPVFNGNFVKPAEAFALQNFDPTHLYRVPEKLLIWLLVLTAIGLSLHLIFSAVQSIRGKRGSQP
jgi:hypothetical protein